MWSMPVVLTKTENESDSTNQNKCIASSGASLPKASGKSPSVEHSLEQL